jgi:uncharacterized protein (DUF2062 family)/2-polyprenyl-3-methyl-5-hydroxy-6-metoxy-1,4-benzoquinol methylase
MSDPRSAPTVPPEGVPPAPATTRARPSPWFRRLYMTLRTEHRTPARVAFAVFVGVFVGCTPLWGLHLLICFLLATLFRLNRVIVYAGANFGNPITGAPILLAEFQVGHRLLHGAWLPISLADVEQVGVQGLVADLALGTLVVGAAMGALSGLIAWLVARESRHAENYRWVADQIVIRYVDVSIRDAEAARASLLRDPIYPFLLEERFQAPGRRVLDLGCGRAIAGALLGIFSERPETRSYLGIDSCERYLRAARQVLEDVAGCQVLAMDLRDFDPPQADIVIVNDVLRYLPFSSQDALLRRLARAMPPGGRIFVREKDAGAGWRFRLSRLADTCSELVPGRPRHGNQYRRAGDLRNALAAAGFTVADRVTYFSSPAWTLLEGVRRPAVASRG